MYKKGNRHNSQDPLTLIFHCLFGKHQNQTIKIYTLVRCVVYNIFNREGDQSVQPWWPVVPPPREQQSLDQLHPVSDLHQRQTQGNFQRNETTICVCVCVCVCEDFRDFTMWKQSETYLVWLLLWNQTAKNILFQVDWCVITETLIIAATCSLIWVMSSVQRLIFTTWVYLQ